MSQKKSILSTPYLTRIAILAALGAALSMIEFPIFPGAPFYKMDPSGLPVILAAFSMGTPAGILTLLVKDLIGLLIHPSGGWVGQLADFLVLLAFIIPPSILYQQKKTRGNALIGMLMGILLMLSVAVLANKYILFPAFGVPNAEKYIIPFTIPFNAIKGVALALITFLIYKPLSPLLKVKMR